MFQADCEANRGPWANFQYDLQSTRRVGAPNRGRIPQRVGQTQHVETLAAASAAIRPDEKDGAGRFQDVGRAGWARFHRSTGRTLREPAASQESHDEEGADDQGD